MSQRIQVLVDAAEREGFRDQAEREGMSLSAWMLEAARGRLREAGGPFPFTPGGLDAFFAGCEEAGLEPDWEESKETIARSSSSGSSPT